MKPALHAPSTPFLLGSLGVHMFAAAISVALPGAPAAEPAGALVYETPGGELDTRPPGEPDFYLVWPSRPVLTIIDGCGIEEPTVVFACPVIPCPPVCGIAALDDPQARLEQWLLEYAALRQRSAGGETFDAAYRVRRAHPLRELRR